MAELQATIVQAPDAWILTTAASRHTCVRWGHCQVVPRLSAVEHRMAGDYWREKEHLCGNVRIFAGWEFISSGATQAEFLLRAETFFASASRTRHSRTDGSPGAAFPPTPNLRAASCGVRRRGAVSSLNLLRARVCRERTIWQPRISTRCRRVDFALRIGLWARPGPSCSRMYVSRSDARNSVFKDLPGSSLLLLVRRSIGTRWSFS